MDGCYIRKQFMCREALIYIGIAMLFCFATGCDQKESSTKPAGTYVASVVRPMADLADDEVVVSVDGENLTKKELSDIARFQAFIYSIQADLPFTDEKVVNLWHQREREGVAEFVIQQILVNEAKRRNLSVTPEVEKEMARTFAGLMKVSVDNATIESLAGIAGVSGRTIRRLLIGNELAQMVQRSLVVAPENIAEADVTNLVANLARINEDCVASNRLQNAMLEEAIKEVKGGMDFAEAAKKFSEIKPEEGAFWGAFSKADLRLYEHSGHMVSKWAFSAPVGSISEEPVQLDDGVGVVKILARTDGVDEPSVVAIVGPSSVELARITRRAFDPPRALSAEDARKSIAEERTKNAQTIFNKNLFLNSRVEYPNGTNLWMTSGLQYKEGSYEQ